MPGMMYHLAFAEEVFRHTNGKQSDKVEFFSGSIVPDLAKNHSEAHFRIPASIGGFQVPDLERAKKEFYDIQDFFKLGIYGHLYLDYYFIEQFLINEFDFDYKRGIVIKRKTGKRWTKDCFFAKGNEGGILYRGYGSINKLIILKGNVDMEFLKEIPEELPATGNPILDKRKEKTWKEELNWYLSGNIPYEGKPFTYEEIMGCIFRIADKFVREEL